MRDLADIYARPAAIDLDTLSNLGPLRRMAGVWRGEKGLDIYPDAAGAGESPFEETIELQPIDPQTNGPQLLYGLRYAARMTKPGEIATYHSQVGYWLWEPATSLVIHGFSIPRGQTVLAQGRASADADEFEVVAARGTTEAGICSTGFLEDAFRTEGYRMKVSFHQDGSWSYFQDTMLHVRGQPAPFHHTDRNTLLRVAAPTPNPMAPAAAKIADAV